MSSLPNSSTIDPALLVAFRQQAAAIVAAERGLTPPCLAKLAGIAQRLGIADEQFDEALGSLALAEPSAPPNSQAEKFRRRLRKDLSVKPGAVIGPMIEAQILAAAKRKYGLAEPVAGEVLAAVASELGLTHITTTDAIRSLAAQIDQAAGNGTWLASEAWERLRAAGATWGVSKEVVDELIDERLKANRSEYFSRNRWTRGTLYCATGAVAVAVVVLGGLVLRQPPREQVVDTVDAEAGRDASRARSTASPTWWSVDLSVELAHIRSQVPEMADAIDLMASAGPNERATGYERFADYVRVAPNREDIHTAAVRIVTDCYLREPDEVAAARLRSAVVALLPAVDSALPMNWTAAFWAADACADALAGRAASSSRRGALADALSSVLGELVDSALPRTELTRRLRQLAARAAYRQLAAAVVKQPSDVAKLFAELSPRAAGLLSDDEFVLAETTFLVTALPAAGSEWRVYERAIARCISSPEALPALRMLEALRRATDAKLVERLSELLTVRAGVRPKSKQKSAVIAAVRQALAAGSTLTAYERWQSLIDEVKPLLAKGADSDPQELLSDSVALAHFTTLAIALAQGETGFAVFDAGLENPPQLLKVGSSVNSRDAPLSGLDKLPRPVGRPLTKTQQRDVSRAIEVLTKTGTAARAERESALRGVAAIAGETSDVVTERAGPIAAYLLVEKSLEEHTAVLAAAGQLRRWKRLRLAVADGLATAKLPLDRQRELATAISGRDLAGRSQDDLRRAILSGVLADLENSGAGSSLSNAENDSLDRAEEVMLETYRQRAALLNALPAAVSAARAPAQAIEVGLSSLSAGKHDPSLAARLPAEQRAIHYLAGSSLHEVVGLERVFVELSAARAAARRPQQAAAARQIAADNQASFAKSPNVLVQLRNQEAALLKIWLLYAPET